MNTNIREPNKLVGLTTDCATDCTAFRISLYKNMNKRMHSFVHILFNE